MLALFAARGYPRAMPNVPSAKRKGAFTIAPVKPVSRAGRPTTPLITLRAAALTALSLIDRDGLDALSLPAVAEAMGVRAPSLYYHFKDKEELLIHVAKAMLEEIVEDQDSWSGDWETRTIKLSLAMRRGALRHPHAVSLLLRFFPRKLMLPAYERTLADCPYPPEAQIVLLEVIEKFTFGASLFGAAAEAQRTPAMPSVDAADFPHLARALSLAPADDEQLHVQSLRVILAGLKVSQW